MLCLWAAGLCSLNCKFVQQSEAHVCNFYSLEKPEPYLLE
jgi:hypothetical protein